MIVYVIIDIFSRYIVGHTVERAESAERAEELITPGPRTRVRGPGSRAYGRAPGTGLQPRKTSSISHNVELILLTPSPVLRTACVNANRA